MKLWLDDERDPTSPYWVNEYALDHDGLPWVWAKTAECAMEHIMAGVVHEMSLDHDLGGNLTGYDVALLVERLAYEKKISRIDWFVHSANPVGSKMMVAALRRADEFWAEAE